MLLELLFTFLVLGIVFTSTKAFVWFARKRMNAIKYMNKNQHNPWFRILKKHKF